MIRREMDNTAKSFAQKIVHELEQIRHNLTSRQQHPSSEGHADQATDEQHIAPPVVSAKPNSVPTAISRTASDKNHKERREAWKFRVEIITAILLFAYTTVAALQWWDIKS